MLTLLILIQNLLALNLHEGFQIEEIARLKNVRSIVYDSTNHVLYAGSFYAGNVYKVTFEKKRFNVVRTEVIASKLSMPVGLDILEGDLYVSDKNRILRFKNINNQKKYHYEIFYDSLPNESQHGWKFIKFGPDKQLYIPIGAPCNVCLKSDARFASITRLDIQSKTLKIIANGVRNSVGFDWHPITNELWFTDNGRDHLGDDIPPCELNRLEKVNSHFGFPFVHGNGIKDPDYFSKSNLVNYVAPVQELGPHVAPLGMEFYSGPMFPKNYFSSIFIAEHGSWNRSKKIGYRISIVKLNDKFRAISYEPFIDGWLQDQNVIGRPVDIEFLPDGSMLISDDFAGKIYRVTYKKVD